jgi:hypothetical protein
VQINAGFLPLSLCGPFGDSLHGSNFGEGKATEKFQIDNLREQRIGFRELVQSFADAGQLGAIRGVFDFGFERGDFKLTAAFLGTAAAGVVND